MSHRVLDGQQRSLSICEYVHGKDGHGNGFAVTFSGNNLPKTFATLQDNEKQRVLDYPLEVYVCEGPDSEKLDWFRVINTVGARMTEQELRNCTYHGRYVNSAKALFSREQAAGVIKANFADGNPLNKSKSNQQPLLDTSGDHAWNRQGFLETARTWIADRGSFPSGTTSSTRNVMQYGYDETTKKNYAISGTYAEPNTRANYTYVGWNTADDGSGKAYNNETALNAIGADANVSNMTLYAHWKTNVTFDSNGGKISNGKTTETISWDVNRVASAGGRTASKSMVTQMTKETIHFAFFGWNTKPNGSGTWIDDYGKITKPVTFYAIFFQGEYAYNGTNYMDGSAQELNIPANGWYKIERRWASKYASLHR